MINTNKNTDIINLYKKQKGNIYKVIIEQKTVKKSFLEQLINKRPKRKKKFKFNMALKNSGEIFTLSDPSQDTGVDPI